MGHGGRQAVDHDSQYSSIIPRARGNKTAQATYPLFHLSNNLLRLDDLFARDLVVLRVVQGGQLNLLVLQLELGARDGSVELLSSLVTELLVDLLGASTCATRAVLVLLRGDRGEFQGKGELEVGLCNEFRVWADELLFIL